MQLKKYAERHTIVFPSLFSEIKLSEKGRVTPCLTIIFKPHIKHHGGEKRNCASWDFKQTSCSTWASKLKKQKKLWTPFIHIAKSLVETTLSLTFATLMVQVCNHHGDMVFTGETTDFPPARAVMKPLVNWWDTVFSFLIHATTPFIQGLLFFWRLDYFVNTASHNTFLNAHICSEFSFGLSLSIINTSKESES